MEADHRTISSISILKDPHKSHHVFPPTALPPWPVWSDEECNSEEWTEPLEEQGFRDPGQVLPPSITAVEWVRPVDLFAGPPEVIRMASSSAGSVHGPPTLDLISPNAHLCELSESIRYILAEISELYDLGLQDDFYCDGEGVEYTPNSEHPWKPWDHIYSLNQAGVKGSRPQFNPDGRYLVRLYYLGCWRKIPVDDRIPLMRYGIFGLPFTNTFELWPLLLTKALLKIVSLTWEPNDLIEVRNFSAISCLTGWVYDPHKIPNSVNDQNLWQYFTKILPKYKRPQFPKKPRRVKDFEHETDSLFALHPPPATSATSDGETTDSKASKTSQKVKVKVKKGKSKSASSMTSGGEGSKKKLTASGKSSRGKFGAGSETETDGESSKKSGKSTKVNSQNKMGAKESEKDMDDEEGGKNENEKAGKVEETGENLENAEEDEYDANEASDMEDEEEECTVFFRDPIAQAKIDQRSMQHEIPRYGFGMGEDTRIHRQHPVQVQIQGQDQGQGQTPDENVSQDQNEEQDHDQDLDQDADMDADADPPPMVGFAQCREIPEMTEILSAVQKYSGPLHHSPMISLDTELSIDCPVTVTALYKELPVDEQGKSKNIPAFLNHPIALTQYRDEPLYKFDCNRPPTPPWKQHRWKKWAMYKGLIPMDKDFLEQKIIRSILNKTPIPWKTDWPDSAFTLDDFAKKDEETSEETQGVGEEGEGLASGSGLYDSPLALKLPLTFKIPEGATIEDMKRRMQAPLTPSASEVQDSGDLPSKTRSKEKKVKIRGTSRSKVRVKGKRSKKGVRTAESSGGESKERLGKKSSSKVPGKSKPGVSFKSGSAISKNKMDEKEDKQGDEKMAGDEIPASEVKLNLTEHQIFPQPACVDLWVDVHHITHSLRKFSKFYSCQTACFGSCYILRRNPKRIAPVFSVENIHMKGTSEMSIRKQVIHSSPRDKSMISDKETTVTSSPASTPHFHMLVPGDAGKVEDSHHSDSKTMSFGPTIVEDEVVPDVANDEATYAKGKAVTEVSEFNNNPYSLNITLRLKDRGSKIDILDWQMNNMDDLDTGFYLFSDSWTHQELIFSLDVLTEQAVSKYTRRKADSDRSVGSTAKPITVIVKSWDWRNDGCLEGAVLVLSTNQSTVAHLPLVAGRHLFRIWMLDELAETDKNFSSTSSVHSERSERSIHAGRTKFRQSESHFSLKIQSRCPIHVGDREETQNIMTNIPVQLLRQADLFHRSIWALLLSFGQSRRLVGKCLANLRKSYCLSYNEMNVINKILKPVHKSFEEYFFHMIQDMNGGMDRWLLYAIRSLLLTPEVGYITMNRKESSKFLEQMHEQKKYVRERADSILLDLEERHNLPEIVCATRKIQRYFRGWNVRRYFQYRTKGSRHYDKVEYHVRTIAYLLAQNSDSKISIRPFAHPENPDERLKNLRNSKVDLTPRVPRYALDLLKFLLSEHPWLVTVYPHSFSIPYHLRIRDMEGIMPEFDFSLGNYQWIPFLRQPILTSGEPNWTLAQFDLQTYPNEGILMTVIDNDTNQPMIMASNRLFVGRLETNHLGYTIFCYKMLDPPLTPGSDRPPQDTWKLRFITPEIQASPILKDVKNSLENSEPRKLKMDRFMGYYIPNDDFCICRYTMEINKPTAYVSIHFKASNPMVRLRLQIWDLQTKALIYEQRSQGAFIVPSLRLEVSPLHLAAGSFSTSRAELARPSTSADLAAKYVKEMGYNPEQEEEDEQVGEASDKEEESVPGSRRGSRRISGTGSGPASTGARRSISAPTFSNSIPRSSIYRYAIGIFVENSSWQLTLREWRFIQRQTKKFWKKMMVFRSLAQEFDVFLENERKKSRFRMNSKYSMGNQGPNSTLWEDSGVDKLPGSGSGIERYRSRTPDPKYLNTEDDPIKGEKKRRRSSTTFPPSARSSKLKVGSGSDLGKKRKESSTGRGLDGRRKSRDTSSSSIHKKKNKGKSRSSLHSVAAAYRHDAQKDGVFDPSSTTESDEGAKNKGGQSRGQSAQSGRNTMERAILNRDSQDEGQSPGEGEGENEGSEEEGEGREGASEAGRKSRIRVQEEEVISDEEDFPYEMVESSNLTIHEGGPDSQVIKDPTMPHWLFEVLTDADQYCEFKSNRRTFQEKLIQTKKDWERRKKGRYLQGRRARHKFLAEHLIPIDPMGPTPDPFAVIEPMSKFYSCLYLDKSQLDGLNFDDWLRPEKPTPQNPPEPPAEDKQAEEPPEVTEESKAVPRSTSRARFNFRRSTPGKKKSSRRTTPGKSSSALPSVSRKKSSKVTKKKESRVSKSAGQRQTESSKSDHEDTENNDNPVSATDLLAVAKPDAFPSKPEVSVPAKTTSDLKISSRTDIATENKNKIGHILTSISSENLLENQTRYCTPPPLNPTHILIGPDLQKCGIKPGMDQINDFPQLELKQMLNDSRDPLWQVKLDLKGQKEVTATKLHMWGIQRAKMREEFRSHLEHQANIWNHFNEHVYSTVFCELEENRQLLEQARQYYTQTNAMRSPGRSSVDLNKSMEEVRAFLLNDRDKGTSKGSTDTLVKKHRVTLNDPKSEMEVDPEVNVKVKGGHSTSVVSFRPAEGQEESLKQISSSKSRPTKKNLKVN